MTTFYKQQQRRDLGTIVRGLFLATPISFEKRLPDGTTWANFFGKYENQRWGVFDTDSCWCLGGAINEAEDQMELLEKMGAFTPEALKWFKDIGLKDSDGDYSFSERYIEILGGRRDNGGFAETAWQLIQEYGCIPRSMLTYSQARIQELQNDVVAITNDYFDPTAVTPAMKAIGKQFRQYVNVAYENIGKKWTTPDVITLKKFLTMAPLSIGIPIPADVSMWNNPIVQYDGSTEVAHEVELYGIDEKGQYMVFDQYEPHLKVLSANYYIPYCTMGVLYATPQASPNPVPQNTLDNDLWTSIGNFFNNAFKSFTFYFGG